MGIPGDEWKAAFVRDSTRYSRQRPRYGRRGEERGRSNSIPRGRGGGICEIGRRCVFKKANGFEQVATIVGALDKNMEVVRHQTVGMERIGMGGGAFEEQERTG